MEIGFLTLQYDPDYVVFAGEAGFDCMEIFASPGGNLDLDTASDDDIKKLNETLAVNNVYMATFAVSVNHLHGESAKRQYNNEYFKKAIRTCKKLNVDVLCTNAWGNPEVSMHENLEIYKKVFSEYAKLAEDEGIKIAIENCPHSTSYPIAIGNIAHSPEMWEAMFELVPSAAIGLEFDPSHLYWQNICPVKALRAFSSRIYSFHAKDTEIVKSEMDRSGIYGKMLDRKHKWDFGVWRYRLPGWGDIDWKAIFRALQDAGYKKPIIIEHEDPFFDGERRKEGLKMGLRFLQDFDL